MKLREIEVTDEKKIIEMYEEYMSSELTPGIDRFEGIRDFEKLNQLNFKDSVEMTVVDGTIVLSKPTPKVRDGWDDAAKQLAASGDDDLVWPDFDNQADEEWVW